MFRVAVAVGLGLAGASALQWSAAAAEAPAAVPAKVEAAPDERRATEELVRELASPDYRTRERAGRELARRGERALPDLRAALVGSDDPETSRRLGVLVRRMEYEKLVAPKRVTLHLKDKPLKEAMDSIAKQSGYKIDFNGGRTSAGYSFDMDGVPFWQAVDAVANAAGLTVYPEQDEEGAIRAYEQDSYNPHVAYSGPFRFLATNVNSSRNIQLSGLNRRAGRVNQNEYVNLNFQVQSEPKTPILGTTFTELTSAADDTGASLVPPPNDPNNQRSHYYNGGQRGFNVYANVNLMRGGKGATEARTIKGRAGIVLLAGTRPEIVVPAPVGAKNVKSVGRTVELDIDSVTEANDQYSLVVTVKRLGTSGTEQHDYTWSNTVWQKIEMQDDKGMKLRCQGPNNQNNAPTVVQLTMAFSREERNGKKPGKPTRLVFNEWLTAVTEVPFEFKNVPLP